MLTLAFVALIRVFLIAERFDAHIDKALIYVPMAFAIVVEALHLIYQSRQETATGTAIEPVHLRHAYTKADDRDAVHAATAGAVGLSRRPVSGDVTDEDGHQEPAGLG